MLGMKVVNVVGTAWLVRNGWITEGLTAGAAFLEIGGRDTGIEGAERSWASLAFAEARLNEGSGGLPLLQARGKQILSISDLPPKKME